MVGHAIDDDDEDKEDNRQGEKPVRRAIRQRRFKKGELALAKHPELRKWVVVKVLEAHPSGRCVLADGAVGLKLAGHRGRRDGMDPSLNFQRLSTDCTATAISPGNREANRPHPVTSIDTETAADKERSEPKPSDLTLSLIHI